MTRVTQRSFTGGVVSPKLYSRSDFEGLKSALKDAVNCVSSPEGPAVSRAGTQISGGYDTSDGVTPQFLIPFEASEDDTYMLEFGDNVMRVLKSGAYVLDGVTGTIDSVGLSDPAVLTMDSSVTAALYTVGRLAVIRDPAGSSPLHTAVVEITNITGAAITFKIVGGVTVDNTLDAWGGIGAGATLRQIYQVATPYAIESLVDLKYAQDVDTLILADGATDAYALARAADASWSFSVVGIAPSVSAPTGLAASVGSGSGSTVYPYRVTAIDEETGEESLSSAGASVSNDLTGSGAYNSLSWTAVSGAQFYRVYRKYNGIFYYIGTAETNSFDDYNITPDTAISRPVSRNPFSGASDKPAAVAFIEQRLTFAATTNNPQVVEMSSSLSPFNFNRSLTPGASDAITFRMRDQKLNRVHHIVPAEQPLILTAGAEWFISTSNNEPMKTGNFGLRPRTYRGSARNPSPIVAGDNLLHVTRDGSTIRTISLKDISDTTSPNLTRAVRHLFDGRRVTSMAYAQAPDSLVWVTLDDGSLFALTYEPDDGIAGWMPQELGGADVFVHQVAVVTEGAIDRPYFVVSRTIDGRTVTLVERLDDRLFDTVKKCYFVDCGLVYDGTATTGLRGLLHLRGEVVSVLADGDVLDNIVVDELGVVDLVRSAAKVSIGLGYDAYIVLLPADFGDIEGAGSSVGRQVSSGEVAVRVVDTRGIAVGIEGGELNEVKQFTGASPIPLSTETFLLDIDADWGRDQSIEVRQTYPLPMTITAVGPTWDMEDA